MQISACLPSVHVCPPRSGKSWERRDAGEGGSEWKGRFYHRNGVRGRGEAETKDAERDKEARQDEAKGKRTPGRERRVARSRKADDIKGRKRGRALNGEMRRQSPKRLLSIVSATRQSLSPWGEIRPLCPTFSYFSCAMRHFGRCSRLHRCISTDICGNGRM